MATLHRTVTGQSQTTQASTDGAHEKRNSLEKRLSLSGRKASTASRLSTADLLNGTLNHLSALQLARLDEFKEALLKDGWWKPDGVNGKPTHDDGTLLRYLRARKFDVNGAVGQFANTEKWMKEQRVDELYEHFDVEFYERARTLYPQWTGRRDKRGIPVYVYEIKGLDSKNVTKYQKESQAYKDKLPNHKSLQTPAKMLPLFALYHNLLNMVLPMCSSMERPNPEIPVTNSTNIVDISGVGLTQFWNLKQHMQDASVLATAHYPETLDRIFIIGAPAFFPTVWGWIKRWFDPVTVSKIFILGKSEVKSTLESYMDIENIPKKYGGQLDWGWGSLPACGEAELRAMSPNGSTDWVKGPCLFLNRKCVAVGTENGKLRTSDEEIEKMKPVLYLADNTEEPVHPDRKATTATSRMEEKTNNCVAVIPSNHEPAAQESKSAAITAAPAASSEASAPTQAPATADKHLNVRMSPSGDSQVHLPDHQAAPPTVTAEYISTNTKPVSDDQAYREPLAPTTTARSSAPDVNSALRSNPVPPVSVPAGMTQPGPLPEHAVQMHQKIAQNLEGESISVIPASANGSLPHPDIIVASDKSKGLAMEADKLALTDGTNQGAASRPPMERFVTAKPF